MIEVKCPVCGEIFLVKEFMDIICPKCQQEAMWEYDEEEDNDPSSESCDWYPLWLSKD